MYSPLGPRARWVRYHAQPTTVAPTTAKLQERGICRGMRVGCMRTALTLEWPEIARISVAEILDGTRKRVRTSTAHQFLMKDLRTGPGISNKDKYLGGGVERERAVFLVVALSADSVQPRLFPNAFLTLSIPIRLAPNRQRTAYAMSVLLLTQLVTISTLCLDRTFRIQSIIT